MRSTIVVFAIIAILLAAVQGRHSNRLFARKDSHKVHAAVSSAPAADVTTSKPADASTVTVSTPASDSGAVATATAAATPIAPLAQAVLSADCSTCGWLVQQVSPCVSGGGSVAKCFCNQQVINAYASCMLCAGTVTTGNVAQVPLTDLVSGCSSGGYSVSAQTSNITSTAKFGSSSSNSSSSNSSMGTGSSSNSGAIVIGVEKIGAFVAVLFGVIISGSML